MQRIGGGNLRGRKLRPLPAGVSGVRPTGARVREAVFDHLVNCQPGGVVEGRRVLDICAGSGALMIEALSRGAIWGTALEQQARVAKHLKSQLAELGLGPRTGVWTGDARKFLDHPGKLPRLNGPYGLVLLDPPYATPDPQTRVCEDRLTTEILARLVAGNWLAPEAVIVREYACFRGKAPELELPPGLLLARTRKYGTTMVDIFSLSDAHLG